MKKIKFFLPFAAVALLASCSDDKQDGPNSGLDGIGNAYFSVSITQSSITRTETPNQGQENPQDGEKGITDVTLVFVDDSGTGETNGQILAVSEKATTPAGTTNGFVQVFQVTETNVANLTGKQNIGVYVICNMPESFSVTAGHNIQYEMELASDVATYWTNNKFLMSNSAAVKITDALPSDWTLYTKENPFPIANPVKVQRAVARFDLYPTMPTGTSAKVGDITVKMTHVSLVNLSKCFYLFKSVGTPGSFKLFEEETATNFVDDPKASEKEALTKKEPTVSNDQAYNDLFIYPAHLTTPKNITDWTEISSLNKDDDNEWESTIEDDPSSDVSTKRDYKIWRYATPSTITQKDKQLNGNTTGIVFKAELDKGSASIKGWGQDNMIALNNVIYGNLAEVKKIANDPTGDGQELVAYYYNLAYAKKNPTPSSDSEVDPTEGDLEEVGFTIYPKNETDNKYYAYYYYWNRHNAEYNAPYDGKMGPMEFGVVRNNVYKLAVTKISGLGLPENKTPDPDDPDDPTPDTDGWFQVSVEIIPWEVRVNDIEF